MIIIPCPCGKSLAAKPEWAGIGIRCSGCGRSHRVSEGVPAPPPPAVEILEIPPSEKPCPLCGESIKLAAIKCRHCGGFLDRPAPAAPAAASAVDPGGVGVLVLALVSWMLLCNLAGPIAWAMGSSYEAACRARGVEPSGAGKAGRILGIVGTVALLLTVGMFVLAAVAGSA